MDLIALALAKKFTRDTVDGMGAIKGKNCVIQSIVDRPDGTHEVTFSWTLDNGTVKTETMSVKDGESAYDIAVEHGYVGTEEEWIASLKGDKGERGVNGIGITSVTKQGTSGLVDTYKIVFSDGSETTFDVVNGANVTKTSQLTNDSDFINRLVTNLVNYYTKAEVYTKEQIDELMRNVGAGLGIAIVDVLPLTDISTTTIYLLANGESNYIQYMYIADRWANLGSTTIDLTNYYTKEQIDNLFLGYVSNDAFQTALAEYVRKEELGTTAFSNSYNDLDDLPEIPSTEGFMKGRQSLGEVDLNECVTEGTFTVTSNSANLPNIPIYGTYVDLQVLSIETVVSQIVRCIVQGEPMMWSRCKIVDHWTDWVHAVSSDMATDELADSSKSIPTSKALFDVKEDLQGQIDDVNDSLVDKAEIDDTTSSATKTYSSKNINKLCGDTEERFATDLNNLVEIGTYAIATDTLHRPSNVNYGFVRVFGRNTNTPSGGRQWIWQEIHCIDGGVFTRCCINPNSTTPTTWSAWQELATMDKVPSIIKETTSATKTYSLDGRYINNIFLGADGSNQCNIMAYIYRDTLCISEVGGKEIPAAITFTKNGNNINMQVPTYWLVHIS